MRQYPKQFKYLFEGTQYHIYAWEPPYNALPKALLIVFHGMDGYVGRSAHIAEYLAENSNITVLGYDFKNFGQTGGDRRGHLDNFEELLATAEKMIDYLCSLYPAGLKVFLTGLSMGGLVAFRLALLRPQKYAGLVLMAPSLRENKQAMPWMKKIGKCVGWLLPSLILRNGENNTGNKFKNQAKLYRQDPHNFTAGTIPGKIRVILNAMGQAQTMFGRLETPYMMIQGGVDKLVDPFQAVDLHKESKSLDKTTVMWKDMWHAVWVEQEILDLLPMMAEWISKRIS